MSIWLCEEHGIVAPMACCSKASRVESINGGQSLDVSNPSPAPSGANDSATKQLMQHFDSYAIKVHVGKSAAFQCEACLAIWKVGESERHDENCNIAACKEEIAALTAEVEHKDAEIERLTAALAEAQKDTELYVRVLNTVASGWQSVYDAFKKFDAITPTGRQDG